MARKQMTEQEKRDTEIEGYREYQKRMNEGNKAIPTGKEKEKILTKTEWLKSKPTGETKNEKFIRLAEKRTDKATKAIQNLKPLTGAGYSSTQAERAQVIEALTEQVKVLEGAFGIGQKEIMDKRFKITPMPKKTEAEQIAEKAKEAGV